MLRVHCVVPEIQSGNKTTTPYLLVAGNPATHHHPRTTGEALVCDLSRATAVIAKGKRPVPFRTRKLSPSAPMVLHWERCGRVGRRRTNIPQKSPTPERVGLFCMPQTMTRGRSGVMMGGLERWHPAARAGTIGAERRPCAGNE